ncbi:MAG: ATP-binding protein [Pseudomonadota bacterium]
MNNNRGRKRFLVPKALQQLGILGVRGLVLTTLIVALLNFAFLIALSQMNSNFDRSLVAPPMVRQAAAAAELLDRLDEDGRALALVATNSSGLRMTIAPDFAATPPVENPIEVFVPVIEVYKAVLGERPFSVYSRSHDGRSNQRTALLTDDLIIVIRLSDGTALVVESSAEFQRSVGLYGIGLVVGFLSLFITGLMVWASLTYARPLSRLAQASQNFVDAVNTSSPLEPLPETGPKPVRDLALAMNTAGSKLVRLTVERTNTLAAVAHDLRTYLTRLRMRSELIEDDTQKAKSIRDIEEMTQLIEDTLSLGEAVAKPSLSERVDLEGWLEAFVAHRVDAGDPIELSIRLQAPIVDIAAAPLSRALNNLIDNAIRYAGEAGVILESGGAGAAQISVQDEGPGVPADYLKQMSEPFSRLETSRSRDTGGAGLGLAIAKAFTEQIGGELSLSNRRDGGFCAQIVLPLVNKLEPAEP